MRHKALDLERFEALQPDTCVEMLQGGCYDLKCYRGPNCHVGWCD